MQNQTQTAALFRQPTSVKKVKVPRVNAQLSNSDAQALSIAVRSFLTEGYAFKQQLITEAKATWELCDKEKPESQQMFQYLNMLKDTYRTVQAKISRLEKIQRQLKKISKNI